MNDHRLKKYKGSLYICGFTASGKSTIGNILAQKLEKPFKDLDDVIVEREGITINEIFSEKGEDYFRKKEWEYLLDLTRNFEGVVALGGGAIQNQQILDHLKIHGLLVFIETSLETITERILRNKHRPILFKENGDPKTKEELFEELKMLYSGRRQFYHQASVKVNTQQFEDPGELADSLIRKIKQHV